MRSDEVRIGDHTVTRDLVVHPGAVGIIALDERDRLLLIRQYRHPVGAYLFEPPAGLPTSYLVAPDGRVVKYFIGPVTAAKLDAAIRAARASAPAHEET